MTDGPMRWHGPGLDHRPHQAPQPRSGAATLAELLGFDPPPADWMVDGACREVGGDVWYPEKGESAVPAKRLCLGCPVRSQCLEYALEHDERFGVWGGLSYVERRRLARRRAGRPADPAAGVGASGVDEAGPDELDELAQGA